MVEFLLGGGKLTRKCVASILKFPNRAKRCFCMEKPYYLFEDRGHSHSGCLCIDLYGCRYRCFCSGIMVESQSCRC